jgi:hypothetical protein
VQHEQPKRDALTTFVDSIREDMELMDEDRELESEASVCCWISYANHQLVTANVELETSRTLCSSS